MAFQGSLSELHLPDIIQLVSVSGKTGVFRLIDGAHKGDIWLHEGRIVHAEHEDLTGEEAVYALAIWRTGEFRFEAGIVPPRQTIQKSNTNLLMEAARRLDEWRVLSKKIPSVELVPEFASADRPPESVQLAPGEILFRQGSTGDLIYVVAAGSLEIVRECADGSEQMLQESVPGDYFGEIGPLFGLPRSATVRARTEAKVIGYTVQAFRERLGPNGVRDLIEHRALDPSASLAN